MYFIRLYSLLYFMFTSVNIFFHIYKLIGYVTFMWILSLPTTSSYSIHGEYIWFWFYPVVQNHPTLVSVITVRHYPTMTLPLCMEVFILMNSYAILCHVVYEWFSDGSVAVHHNRLVGEDKLRGLCLLEWMTSVSVSVHSGSISAILGPCLLLLYLLYTPPH